jgi:chromosome partitioning protein
MEGIEPVIAGADRLKHRCGTSQELLGIVINLADRRARFAKDNARQLRKAFGDRVLSTEVRANVRLAEAPAHGQTIFQYDPESLGATDYRRLAREILERCSTRSDGTPPAARRSPMPSG